MQMSEHGPRDYAVELILDKDSLKEILEELAEYIPPVMYCEFLIAWHKNRWTKEILRVSSLAIFMWEHAYGLDVEEAAGYTFLWLFKHEVENGTSDLQIIEQRARGYDLDTPF